MSKHADIAEHVLVTLTEGGKVSTARLAKQTGITPIAAARVLNDLVAERRIINYGGTYALRAPLPARAAR